MPAFTDTAYHATELDSVRDIFERGFDMSRCRGEDSFCGKGIYFWEDQIDELKWWAKTKPLKVPCALVATVRFGLCLNFTQVSIRQAYEKFGADMRFRAKDPRKQIKEGELIDAFCLDLERRKKIKFDTIYMIKVLDGTRSRGSVSPIPQRVQCILCVRELSAIDELGILSQYPEPLPKSSWTRTKHQSPLIQLFN